MVYEIYLKSVYIFRLSYVRTILNIFLRDSKFAEKFEKLV